MPSTPEEKKKVLTRVRRIREVLESHIRETFDRNDCYSREVSQSVDDTIELVRAYLK